MCEKAPHSEIETNAGPDGGASLSRRWGAAHPVMLLTLATVFGAAAGCTETCLLNGDCPTTQICLDGSCQVPCTMDVECPIDLWCIGGGCRDVRPGERPPCRDDAGCDAGPEASLPRDAAVDAETDAETGAVVDATMADAVADASMDALVDASTDAMTDALVDAAVDAAGDGALADGGPDGRVVDAAVDAIVDAVVDAAEPLDPADDLSGLYAVGSTVIVTTGGPFSTGDVEQRIHRLIRRQGTVYDLEVYTTDGILVFVAGEIDFRTPEGPMRYQFEFPRALPIAVEACEGVETRFQRGSYVAGEAFGFVMTADEERTIGYAGEACGLEGYLERMEVVWQPLPPADAPPADAPDP